MMDHLVTTFVQCACAVMIWIGSVHTASFGEEYYKKADEKCPQDYYPGEYPTQCLACSGICHDNMEDYFVDLNCHVICPEYYARLTVTSSVTVALNPSALKLPQQHALGTWTIVLIVVLVISALILGAAVVFLRPWKHTTNRNKASSWRASRDRSSSNQAESNPIPVQNGDVGAPTSAIVPSGTRYTDSIDMHTPLRMVIRQTSV